MSDWRKLGIINSAWLISFSGESDTAIKFIFPNRTERFSLEERSRPAAGDNPGVIVLPILGERARIAPGLNLPFEKTVLEALPVESSLIVRQSG